MKKKLDKTFIKLSKHYDSLVRKYGDNVKSSQQSTSISRDKRLQNLLKNIDIKKTNSILDFGCGTGYLYNYLNKLKFKGRYTGIDISFEAINFAKKNLKKNKNCDFMLIDILKNKLNRKYDYILINGTFNNNTKNNWFWMKKCLEKLFLSAKKGIVFNNLSSYVDYKDKKLFYIEPEKVFQFCKKILEKRVMIDNTYQIKKNVIPYEFTTFIKK